MQSRDIDDNARMRKRRNNFGDEINGADSDVNGKKQDNEFNDADDVERNDNDCDCDATDDDDDDDDNDGDSVLDTGVRIDTDANAVIDLQKARRALSKCICSEGRLDVVDLAKELNPLLSLDYDSLKGDCLQIYEEEKLRVKHILTNMDGQISLSFDILSYFKRNGSSIDFMCLAAHFIDDKWKLKKWVLSFQRIWDTDILKSVKDWDIEGKISGLTLANSNIYEEEVQIIKDGVQEKKRLQLNGQLFCVNCCAEMFSKMVEDACKEISNIISKVRSLISWNYSPQWDFTAFNLKEALDLESNGEFSSQQVRDNYDVPSADEWRKVKCVYKLVETAHNVAKSLFETKYPTANIFLHNLQELRAIFFQESISSDGFTSNVAKKMLQRIDKYLNDMFLVLAIASVMDPRYKMRYIEYLSSKCEKSDGNSQSTLVLDAIRSLHGDYVDRDLEREHSMSDSTSEDSEEELTRTPERGSCNSNWLQEYNQFTESNIQPPKSDLDRYLEEPVLAWSQDFNVLKWWRAESPKYPILSKMARDFLAIPMSVATSYDAYYTQRREADPHVVLSGPGLRNALMCTRSWAGRH